LGRKKIDARKERTQKQLRTLAFQAAHGIVDKAAVVVSEDLTSPIAAKQQWKQYNRRMSAWAKGVLAEALDSVCMQRQASHELVCGAYTSQMDSATGLLHGKRVGDKFYRENGDVLQADHNAALNVLARLDDPDISRFTPHGEVRRIVTTQPPEKGKRGGLRERRLGGAQKKGLHKGIKDWDALFGEGGAIRADAAVVSQAQRGAKAAGDFLLDLGHTHGLFGEVVGEGDAGMGEKARQPSADKSSSALIGFL
jgi:hypothetical protein